MYYITVGRSGVVMEVGKQEDLSTALNYADNIGNFFSDRGVTKPQYVTVRVQDLYETVVVEQQYYNGHVRVTESKGV